MLVKALMTEKVICCTPWFTAQAAADLMKKHGVGSIPVVAELSDPLIEGIITDRDLCCGSECAECGSRSRLGVDDSDPGDL